MARPKLAELPAWPRLMDAETAAAYCGRVSAVHFRSTCPVRPQQHGRRVLWDRHRIDAWLDSLQGDDAPAPVSVDDWLARLP